MNRPIYEGGMYNVLSDKEIRQIHDTTIKVLEEVGFEIPHEPALKLFKENGARVDEETHRVYLTREFISRTIKQAPEEFTFYGREEGKSIVIGGKRVHFGTGGLALYVLDLNREKRPSYVEDISNLARLTNKLEYVDFYIIPVYPHDLNIDTVDISSFYRAFKNTSKPVMGGILSKEGLESVIDIASTIAGSLDELKQKPFVGFIASITSPLKISEDQVEYLMEVASYGLPLATSTAPVAGATSPITLAGTLVQQNAEALMGVIISQLVNPGTPVLYSAVPVTMDMRTMSFLMGSIESGLMNAAITQMAHHYRLPCYITVGTTDSKLPDAQAAHESATTSMLAALAGGNFIHEAIGLLDGAMTASYAQYVIDNDIVGSCLRALKGIEINEDSLALEVISKVGPGGNFLSEKHTVKHLRSERYSPLTSDRQHYKTWLDAGSKDSWQRAEEIAKNMLEETENITYIDENTQQLIKNKYPHLQ